MAYWQSFLHYARIAAMFARSKEDGTVEGSNDFWYFDVQKDNFFMNKKKLPWEML